MTDKIVKAVKVDANGQPIADAPSAAPAIEQKHPPRFLREAGSKTIPLQWPLEYDGIEYREITVGRLRGKAFRAMQALQGKHDDDDIVLHCMSGVPIAVIQALDAEDYAEAVAATYAFLPEKMLARAAELADTTEAKPSDTSEISGSGESTS